MLDVKRPAALCLPAAAPGRDPARRRDAPRVVRGTAVADAADAAEAGRRRPARHEPVRRRRSAGEDADRAPRTDGRLFRLAVVSADDPRGGRSLHLLVRGAHRRPPEPPGLRRAAFELATALGTLLVDVRAPAELCFPADTNGNEPTAPAHPDALRLLHREAHAHEAAAGRSSSRATPRRRTISAASS